MPRRQAPSSPVAVATRPTPHGRDRQRRRTRTAIVDAAAALLARGTTPSVADIAAAADVSRRTVYLYFPTLEQLLLDATLGLLTETAIDQVLDEPPEAGADDAEARVERMVRALGRMMADTLPLGRSLIRLTVESSADSSADGSAEAEADADAARGAPRRGYRRIGWIERALAPLRGRLDDERFERLVSALAVVIGWEAFIVLSDIRRLERAEQVEVACWAARALVRAALAEADSQTAP